MKTDVLFSLIYCTSVVSKKNVFWCMYVYTIYIMYVCGWNLWNMFVYNMKYVLIKDKKKGHVISFFYSLTNVMV